MLLKEEGIFESMHLSTVLIGFAYLLNLALILVIVFRERKRPAQTWAWILVLTFIPVVGFFLYIFFGHGISKDKIFDLRGEEKIGMIDELKEQEHELKQGTFPVPHTRGIDVNQLIYMMTVDGGSLYTQGNDVALYTDGTEKFEHLLRDLDSAQHHIHMEYYIFRSDELGTVVRNKLILAAKRGVKVKLLLDAWGCSSLKKHFFDALIAAGGEVEFFFPILIPYINPRVNYRNHRKIVVIDGHVGYTGGFNVGDEYLGIDPKFGYWRDNHLRIEGSAVYSLQNRFLMDWNSHHKPEEKYQLEYFPRMKECGQNDVQIITSGPDNTREQIKMAYLKMINMAQKEILIQTPYYIPDDSIHEALKLALLSGVKVTIQIPNKPDHILVYWATYSLAAELLDYGAQIEIYDNGFMHAKTMIIDGQVASVGSANIDIRSFRLDFEVNTLIYNEAFVRHLRETYFETSTQCHLLTKEIYENRGRLIKFKEGLARLIQPLL